MFAFNNDPKIAAMAADLAQAMRRRYGPEAEAICNEALARGELNGWRRQLTRRALQILSGLAGTPELQSATGSGQLGAA